MSGMNFHTVGDDNSGHARIRQTHACIASICLHIELHFLEIGNACNREAIHGGPGSVFHRRHVHTSAACGLGHALPSLRVGKNSRAFMTQQAIGAAPVVFVVDDDIDVREGLKSLVESAGLRCEVFASTQEFLPRKAADTVSCLVLDVRLPGMSGLDLQAELARTHADIPTIFITGYGDIPMAVKAMTAGAVEFLTKPVREQALLDAVGIALERDRIRRERDSKLNDLRSALQIAECP